MCTNNFLAEHKYQNHIICLFMKRSLAFREGEKYF